ncbi:cupin domain-containing protein [Azohydromonas lata]|uniref:cupin domain-containing protein n=1 Tax=Azohydromonas lata TaxID=45677 RepID=UPI00082F31E6|nr:cupin domain-containing protein [Azohydromonas lata]
MSEPKRPVAVVAEEAPLRTKPSNYPEPFASRMAGRTKRTLGDLFGLGNFGVNLVHLAPGAVSALRHAHARQDEFVYVLRGHPTLCTDAGDTPLSPGMCAGFQAGTGDAHCLRNDTAEEAVYLEVGDRTPGDAATYPDDDLRAVSTPAGWRFEHKDGMPY